MEIDHLSASQVNTYLTCPMRYYFRYCEGERVKPKGALTLGSSFHSAVGWNYSEKIDTHEDLPVEEVLDFFSDDFDMRTPDTEWDGEEPGSFKDRGAGGLELYQAEVAPIVQPAAVEQAFTMKMSNKPWSFKGILDVLDENQVIVETKTTSRRTSKPKPEHLLQATAYATGFRCQHRQQEGGVRLDYVVAIQNPELISFPVAIEETDITFFLNQISRVAHAIEQEVWIANRASFLCSRKWCGYYQLCEKQVGGTVKE